MELPDWVVTAYSVVCLIVGVIIGVVTPWAKLKCSKEYRDAKEERIKAKDEALKVKDETLKGKGEALKLKDETLNAKDEALRVKEAHIERLKDQIAFLETINPLMLRDYYANTLKGLL